MTNPGSPTSSTAILSDSRNSPERYSPFSWSSAQSLRLQARTPALEKVRETQQGLDTAEESLALARKDLEAAKLTVTNLKQDVEQVLAEAKANLGEISARRSEANALVVSIRALSPQDGCFGKPKIGNQASFVLNRNERNCGPLARPYEFVS